MPRVLDIDNVELFGEAAADLIAYHGITIHEPADMRQGEWYWANTLLDEREGPACCIYTGLLADGSLAVGQECAWAWADDVGEADEILGNNYPTDWQEEADLGNLNENGNMGPAFGQSGWYHDPYEPGPGRAWIRDELRWSVLLTGIGMLGMTNHRTLYPTWQLKQWQGNGEDPPDDEKIDMILAGVKENRVLLLEIKGMLEGFSPEEPPLDGPYWAQYYANKRLAGIPVLERWEEKIDHDWGTGSPPGVPSDDFSARWTSTRWFDAGPWAFCFRGDDGMRFYVDGNLVFDQWHDQAPTSYEVKVDLSEGWHVLEMQFYERGGGAVCEMWYNKT